MTRAVLLLALLLTACGDTRPPLGSPHRISGAQLIVMTRDHLATLGGMGLQ